MSGESEEPEPIHPRGFPLKEVRCERCIYWNGDRIAVLFSEGPAVQEERDCWRYPQRVKRHPKEWCGEFDPKPGAMP
jgi:hypothetical protein